VELNWIRAFVAVAEELHFGRAADRLRVAYSPLSQTIRKLENELGVQLFKRNTRSVALTVEGASYLPHARAVLNELRLGQQAVHSHQDTTYGTVTVGYSGALNHRTLPKLTQELARKYPNIELVLEGSVLTADALSRLKHGTLDLSFIGLPAPMKNIERRVVSREPLGVVLPTAHPLASATQLNLADLSDDRFITLPHSSGSALRETVTSACLEAGFRPHVVQEASDAHTIMSMVAAGIGVSLMPECVADINPAGTVYVPLYEPASFFDAAIAWNPARVSDALEAVLEVVESTLALPATSTAAK
jgi:DNA-binding transcriptional LysR family regulator